MFTGSKDPNHSLLNLEISSSGALPSHCLCVGIQDVTVGYDTMTDVHQVVGVIALAGDTELDKVL